MEWAPGVQDPSLLAREVQDRAAREDPKLILLCMYDDPTTSMASQTDFIMYDDDPTIWNRQLVIREFPIWNRHPHLARGNLKLYAHQTSPT